MGTGTGFQAEQAHRGQDQEDQPGRDEAQPAKLDWERLKYWHGPKGVPNQSALHFTQRESRAFSGVAWEEGRKKLEGQLLWPRLACPCRSPLQHFTRQSWRTSSPTLLPLLPDHEGPPESTVTGRSGTMSASFHSCGRRPLECACACACACAC